ncbi:hypothetical protein PYCC9005_005859 [Savitreella phatthalungensis]
MATTSTGRFPLGYSASLAQWWGTTSTSGLATQNRILEISKFFTKPDHRTAIQSFVTLTGRDRVLNEVHIRATDGKPATSNMVILHGYGAGLGLFFRNFEGLSSLVTRGWGIYALDLLGMGLSSRPAFKVHAKDPVAKVREAEDFFLDAIEEWREIRRLEQIVLVAHSLGGYLATRYANKYPDRVEKLVLVSPVGIPKNPYHTETPPTTVASELEPPESKPAVQPLPRWVTTLWEANVSPFSFVRFGTVFGPKVVSAWTYRRFGHLSLEERDLLHAYAYEIFRRKGSGEYALAYLLAPGAYARDHLLNSIPTHCKTLLLYGDRDWMDVKAGAQASSIARSKGGDSQCEVISDAGHHVYLDNPADFNAAVLDFVK